MSTAKLRVDLSGGVLEVEGNEAFVRDMHAQFQAYVGNGLPKAAPSNSRSAETTPDSEGDEETTGGETKTRRKSGNRRRRPVSAEPAGTRKSPYEPRVLPDENFSDLPAFLAGYAPKKGHKELIPLFATYLANEKNISPFSGNHLFTCYRFAKIKPPAAFTQTLYDARGKYHFLKFDSFDEMTLTHIGETFAEHDIAKREASE